MSQTGLTVNVLYDFDTNTLNVNNNVLKITGVTQGNNGLTSESFITGAGTAAYYSLSIDVSAKVTLYEFNTVTQELLNQINLACVKNQ